MLFHSGRKAENLALQAQINKCLLCGLGSPSLGVFQFNSTNVNVTEKVEVYLLFSYLEFPTQSSILENPVFCILPVVRNNIRIAQKEYTLPSTSVVFFM